MQILFNLRAAALKIDGFIVLSKAHKELNLDNWKGRCRDVFAKLGYSSVDKFMDDIRGR